MRVAELLVQARQAGQAALHKHLKEKNRRPDDRAAGVIFSGRDGGVGDIVRKLLLGKFGKSLERLKALVNDLHKRRRGWI